MASKKELLDQIEEYYNLTFDQETQIIELGRDKDTLYRKLSRLRQYILDNIEQVDEEDFPLDRIRAIGI